MRNETVVSHGQIPASCAGVPALLLAATTGMTSTAVDSLEFRGPNGSGIAASGAMSATVARQLFLHSNRTLYCIEAV